MHNRFLRPLLIVEFLIAIQVFFTLWSQVGGQYHLDLMFWPWKLGLAVAAATLIVAITASLVRHDGEITRRALFFGSLLLATLGIAGVVTYYYHLNEPTDQQEPGDEPAKISNIIAPVPSRDSDGAVVAKALLPALVFPAPYQVRHAFPPRTIGSPSLHPKAF